MEQNPQPKKSWYKRPVAMIAMAAIVLVAGYFLVTLFLLPSKKSKVQMYVMILTEDHQRKIFDNDKITEVKFEWVLSGSDLNLTAVGGYEDGGRMVYVEDTRAKLEQGNATCPPDTYKYDSPLYMTRGDFKALHDLPTGTAERISPGDIGSAIRLTPYCDGHPEGDRNVYCEASTASGSRPANPMPPFTSPCVSRCEE